MFAHKFAKFRQPNFFLIGAAKCGTTSLARYLAGHPHILFSNPKEPHYFSTDIANPLRISSESDYKWLFRGAKPCHRAIGEGSVSYIQSQVAVPRILGYSPDAKFLVMIRSPIEMFQALHTDNLVGLGEDEPDIERAWRLQDQRRSGRDIPPLCFNLHGLLYGDYCRLSSRLRQLHQWVPRERVWVGLLDDLRKDPNSVYEAALAFLNLPSDGRTQFPIINQSKRLRSQLVMRATLFCMRTKRRFGIRRNLRVATWLTNINVRRWKRPPLRREFHAELCDYFRDEVEELSSLIDRDLSSWLNVNA
jgi:hypothetical protein